MEPRAQQGLSIDSSSLIMLQHVVARARLGAQPHMESSPGPIATRRRGRGSEIDDIRVWSVGDDIRHIDRNSTARTGVPHVKTFRDEREQTTLLLADFRPPMLFGTRRAYLSVAAAEVLSLAGWRAIATGARVGLLAFGDGEPIYVKPRTGNRAMLEVIGAMARAHPVAAGNRLELTAELDTILDMAARLIPRSGTAILATSLDGRGASFEESVRRFLHRAHLHIALIDDAFKDNAPRGRFPFVTLKGATGVKIVSAGASKSAAKDATLDELKRTGARLVRFRTDVEPQEQLVGLRELHGGLL